MKKKTLAVLLLLSLPIAAEADAVRACPFKPDDLTKVFGVKFDAGTEEPGMGGTGCKYKTQGGSMKNNTDFSLWVLMLPPGPDQEMIRKFTAGPGAKFVPVKGDPHGAERIVHDDGMPDVTYRNKGHVVILRGLVIDHEPDAKARAARAEQFNARLLKLPRLP